MSSFLVAAVAALAAAVGAGLLVRDCARLPRIEVVPWLVAAAGLTLALVAQAAGYSRGFGPTTFRAVQIAAQMLAPLALAWGLIEVTGRSVTARFAGRLAVSAVTVIAGVIMATDPLSSAPFTKAWPTASVHYQPIPNGVLVLIAAGTVLAALVAVVVTGVRSRREPAWQGAFVVAAAGGAGTLVIQLLRMSLPFNSAYAGVCLVSAALAWFAGTRSDARQWLVPAERGRYQDDDAYGGLYRPGDTGRRGYRGDPGSGYADTGYPGTGYGEAGPETGWGTYGGRDVSDTGYGFYRDDTGGLRAISDTGYGLYRDEDTGSMVFADGPGGSGPFAPGDMGFGLPGPGGAGVMSEEEEEGTARLYGQIAIYTLLEGRAGEFDELAQDVVAKVKAREPETLVFVMHGVPSAPMQRILYEVYRDQAAFEHHAEQPYVRDFEERRKAYVLATNVIELGVRQAKVSPLAQGEAPQAGPGPDPMGPHSPAGPRPAAGAPGRRPAAGPRGPGPGPDPLGPGSAGERRGSRPGADPLGPGPGADPLGPGSAGERRGSRPGADPLEPPAPADPPGARSGGGRARSRRTEPADPPPAEGDFWTRAPADPPDDGSFWDRYP